VYIFVLPLIPPLPFLPKINKKTYFIIFVLQIGFLYYIIKVDLFLKLFSKQGANYE